MYKTLGLIIGVGLVGALVTPLIAVNQNVQSVVSMGFSDVGNGTHETSENSMQISQSVESQEVLSENILPTEQIAAISAPATMQEKTAVSALVATEEVPVRVVAQEDTTAATAVFGDVEKSIQTVLAEPSNVVGAKSFDNPAESVMTGTSVAQFDPFALTSTTDSELPAQKPTDNRPTQQFWQPFQLATSAHGFAEHINKTTGVTIEVIKLENGKFGAVFRYIDEVERTSAIKKIESGIGIKLDVGESS